ncbi:XrtA/PEP-CTERM system exopolysaccharide export protein [Alishewanella sp. SMS8]|uniref:XrtA/PEP-CTERM system exopolysaccharide export protein n=1 Tax=Alishewanella sp. SMS8 TaxID=2994676 RepID=UPI002740B4F0|nr:XrtA/PEP-CTERM system exopolysaccharide export protein [Alishewanella sp. SMS8]MDP5458144.1 polysaccharide export protein [Alishewanella sp. SMS8]
MNNKLNVNTTLSALFASTLLLSGCAQNSTLPRASVQNSVTTSVDNYQYLIGPDDSLTIFVWRNPELSGNFIVRPDGKISTSLIEDVEVSGKTPTQLARDMELILAKYIRDPVVTVSVNNFVGPYSEQVRVIGQALNPQAVNYRQYMTLLDVMITVGGLTEFADGNNAKLVRTTNGSQRTYNIRLDDLVREGEISANVDILPGDIIIVPEAWF